MYNSILEVREREGNGKKPIPKIREQEGNEKKNIPKIQEWEGNKKIYSQTSGTGREWKKCISAFHEQESEAIIPGNTRDREWKKQNKIRQYEKSI